MIFSPAHKTAAIYLCGSISTLRTGVRSRELVVRSQESVVRIQEPVDRSQESAFKRFPYQGLAMTKGRR